MISPFIRSLTLLLMLAAATGCTPPEEKITKVMQGHLERCRSAEGDFATIKLFGGKQTRQVLRASCQEPITGLRLQDKFKATAMVGPYKWLIDQDTSSGVWVVSDIAWREMTDAQRVLAEEDRDETTLVSGIKHLEAVEKKLPDSTWVKKNRLALMLELRQKTRSRKGASEQEIAGLGADTQAYYDSVLSWAKAKPDPDMRASARHMIIDYYQDYDRFIDSSLSNQGSGDETLENAAKLEEKEGRPEKAKLYREQLRQERAARIVQTGLLTKRQARVKQALCEELSVLSADGVKDEALKAQVSASKKGAAARCAPAAAP